MPEELKVFWGLHFDHKLAFFFLRNNQNMWTYFMCIWLNVFLWIKGAILKRIWLCQLIHLIHVTKQFLSVQADFLVETQRYKSAKVVPLLRS